MGILGAALVVLFLAVTTVLAAWFFQGVGDPSWGTAASMVFPFVVILWLAIGIPLWSAGISLWASHRQGQRGAVPGAVAAWILALAAMPCAALLLILLVGGSALSTAASSVLFVAFVLSLPVGLLLALLSGAWLIWGRARTVTA